MDIAKVFDTTAEEIFTFEENQEKKDVPPLDDTSPKQYSKPLP